MERLKALKPGRKGELLGRLPAEAASALLAALTSPECCGRSTALYKIAETLLQQERGR